MAILPWYCAAALTLLWLLRQHAPLLSQAVVWAAGLLPVSALGLAAARMIAVGMPATAACLLPSLALALTYAQCRLGRILHFTCADRPGTPGAAVRRPKGRQRQEWRRHRRIQASLGPRGADGPLGTTDPYSDCSPALAAFLLEEEAAGRFKPSVERPVEPLAWGRWVHTLLRLAVMATALSAVTTLCCLPAVAGAPTVQQLQALAAVNGVVNFSAAEVQAQQKAQLQALRELPHDAPALAAKFHHGLNAQLPHGVSSKTNPDELWKDPETGLLHHRIPGLSEPEFQQLVAVCREHAEGAVAYSLERISGYTGTLEPPMTIELNTTARIFQPPRRNYAPSELAIIDEKVEALEKVPHAKEIRHSDYACNPVLAAKRAPDGSWSDKRFCINFIPINKHTTLDRYGCHRAEDLFQRVSSKKYLTALDLRSGFHQIPMAPQDIPKTAFWHVSGKNRPPRLMAYTHMPFGLKNASAKFQRVMDAELQAAGCTEFAFAYIDDLLIASDSWEEHVQHVGHVLRMLKAVNLRIHPDKSVFGTNVVEYLGHNVVGQHGITMNDAKVESIKVLPNPKDVSQLRSILGFLAYYRHFIPGFSSISAPMTQLLHKNQPWQWGPAQQQSYDTLKALMTDPAGPVLRPVDRSRPLLLHTDWCNHGIGAVLGQLDDEGQEYLCGCASRSLNKHERNYPSYKGELLALTWATKTFRHHLHGTSFKLVTDHQPLLWLMKSKELSGQYARWQMLLQEHDFEIIHRPGAKHNNADTLSRYPRPDDRDFTGARMDAEEEPAVAALMAQPSAAERRHQPPAGGKKAVTIDSFCPKFKDLLTAESGFMDAGYYMNSAMRPPDGGEREEEFSIPAHWPDDSPQEPLAVLAAAAVAEAKPALRAAAKAAASHLSLPTTITPPRQGQAINTGVVAGSFFPSAAAQGITMLELCGGMAAGVEAAVLAGHKVNRYRYADINPTARKVAEHRLCNLTARYPHLLSPEAWADAFMLPHDISHLQLHHLDAALGEHTQQVLVLAGWPCQDYSSAGLGRQGKRAELLEKVTQCIAHLQRTQPQLPVAYILENVAMQHNFRHKHVREEVAAAVMTRLGEPVTFDAATVGSYAARLRNYWTNLASPTAMQLAVDQLQCEWAGDLYQILEPGRHPMPVEPGSLGHCRNVPGKARRVLPTLMAFHQSRAFRMGRAGSIYDTNTGQYTEPVAVERELAMGYQAGTTAAAGVTDRQRCELLGQAMDLNALFTVFQLAATLHQHGLAEVAAVARKPALAAARVAFVDHGRPEAATAEGDRERDSCRPSCLLAAYVGQQPTDVWEDAATILYLQDNTLPAAAPEARRVLRRSRGYRWYNQRLYKVIAPDQSAAATYRLIPEPAAREQLVTDQHQSLGHLGEKRTIAAMSATYWWYGMTVDIRRVLACCKLCSRVRASGGHQQRDMQTEPTGDFGIFHRWGLDYIADLPSSALGNRHALVAIDYYSKWIEVIPTPVLDSATTARIFLLEVLSRYGVPAEIICDNGGSFKEHFQELCAQRGIHQRFITPDVPRSNGLAERAVQTVKRALRKHAAEKGNALTWDTDGLSAILSGYRCTPHAASGHSPARVLFAVDPVLDAEQYFSRAGAIDYQDMDKEKITNQLLQRAALAKEMGMEVVHNLRTAHERDAQRFKAFRSGLYIPKVYHFHPGDHVFVLTQGVKPGGTLGIRARHEVLQVVKVQPSGVLILTNQAGQHFSKHMEHCVPCLLPNMLGETHAGLAKPPADHPCQVCKDHRNWDLMLLCDNCNGGYHTYCLDPPLEAVPDGDWLCPSCLQHGMTLERLHEKQRHLRLDTRSRPALELPSRSRLAKHRKYADEWHGTGVRHAQNDQTRFGRVRILPVHSRHWFSVDWQDGTSTQHMGHILPHLTQVDDASLPAGVPGRPPPATFLAARPAMRTLQQRMHAPPAAHVPAAVLECLQRRMPGAHGSDADLAETSNHLAALYATPPSGQRDTGPAYQQAATAIRLQQALCSLVDFRSVKQVVHLVHSQEAERLAEQMRTNTSCPVLLNHPVASTSCHLHQDPVHGSCYQFLRRAGGADVFFLQAPTPLLDLILPRAAAHCNLAVFANVSRSWVDNATPARFHWLHDMGTAGRLLTMHLEVANGNAPPMVWLAVFAGPEERESLMSRPLPPLVSNLWVRDRTMGFVSRAT